MDYLASLPPGEAKCRWEAFCRLPVGCVILSTGIIPPDDLLQCGESYHIPVFTTPLESGTLISRLTSHLEELLSPSTSIHGVFLDVYGVGVLILGRSGIGKSECALELVIRGHRLVTDDIVQLKLRAGEVIMGTSPELTRYLIEIRGLGILNIKDLFGVTAVRYRKRVELVVNLIDWCEDSCERLGLDEQGYSILGVNLPLVNIPVGPGRTLAVIVEVAARNQLLKLQGQNTAEQVERKLAQQLALPEKSAGGEKTVAGDTE